MPFAPSPPYPRRSNEAETTLFVVAAEDAGGAGAEPVFDHLRVHRAEIGFVMDIAGIVFEGGILRIGVQIGGRAVKAAADPSAHCHHDSGGAMVGAAAAVFTDPPAE